MAGFSPKFYQRLMEISSSTGLSPEHILNVMASESDLNPAAGKGNTAAGLIQIMPKYLKNYGYQGTPDDFRKETAEAQLDYVEKVIKAAMKFNGGKPFKSATQYYVSNFLPACLKLPGVQQEDPKTILASKDPTELHIPGSSIDFEKKVYAANAGLDEDHNGDITYGDLQVHLAKIAKRPSFLNAIRDLKTHTGYQSNIKMQDMLVNHPEKEVMRNKPMSDTLFTLPAIENILDNFLQKVRASEKNSKSLYKKYLPKQNMLIKVEARDSVDAVEFSRILCKALDEELMARTNTFIDLNNVEIECEIDGSSRLCVEAVREITQAITESFKQATRKIGGININTKLIINKKSSYEKITSKYAELNYRKFLFKFA